MSSFDHGITLRNPRIADNLSQETVAFSRTRDMEQYVAERVFSLREMARLGIARGATHIVWA